MRFQEKLKISAEQCGTFDFVNLPQRQAHHETMRLWEWIQGGRATFIEQYQLPRRKLSQTFLFEYTVFQKRCSQNLETRKFDDYRTDLPKLFSFEGKGLLSAQMHPLNSKRDLQWELKGIISTETLDISATTDYCIFPSSFNVHENPKALSSFTLKLSK